jgi:SAM-dependent methyltransferase
MLSPLSGFGRLAQGDHHMSRYAIGGGREGKERLNLMSRVLSPTTSQLLHRAGLERDMHCLDVGCGGGNVTLLLAREVGPLGRVVGSDLDAEILALAEQDAREAQLHNLEFRRADAAIAQEAEAYDLVYARFVLTHVSEPLQTLKAMVKACKPTGLMVIEDIDFSGSFCYPDCQAYRRFLELYKQVIERRGGDPDIGQKLPGMFARAGLTQVQINVIQPADTQGDVKLVAAITMARIADSLIAEGLATASQVEEIIADLNEAAADPQILMSMARIFQVWGRRA